MTIYEKNGIYHVFDITSKKIECFIELKRIFNFDKYHTFFIFEIEGNFYQGTLLKYADRMPNLTLDETYKEIKSVFQKRGSDFEILDEKKNEVVEMTIFDFL